MKDIQNLYAQLKILKAEFKHALINDYSLEVVNDLYLQIRELENQILKFEEQLN